MQSIRKYLASAILFSTVFSFIFLIAHVFAQAATPYDPFKDVCKHAPSSGGERPATCVDKSQVDPTKASGNPIYGPNGIIIKIVNVITILVGVAAVVSIIVAGAKFMTSGSNPQDVTQARELIIYALVGVALAATAQLIMRFIITKI